MKAFAGSVTGKIITRLLATAMESRFRYRFFAPGSILLGVDDLQGRAVLEIGCGTGFFSIPAARLVGAQGSLTAMDILPESVELVRKKADAAGLRTLQATIGDARHTGFEAESFDTVLLFGVIPAPMLPLGQLLPEVQRVLKPGGSLAVWPPVPFWLPRSVVQTGLFTFTGKRHGVHNFRRC